MNRGARRGRGFTLIELIVVVAIVGVILTLAGPSFYDYIVRQRLKSVHAQLVTDLALARSQAAASGTTGRIAFDADATQSCYTIYTVRPVANHEQIGCDCLAGAGAACPTEATEIRTVRLDRSQGIQITVALPDDWMIGFDPADGSILWIPTDAPWAVINDFVVDVSLNPTTTLRTTVGRSGRLTVCATRDGLGAPGC